MTAYNAVSLFVANVRAVVYEFRSKKLHLKREMTKSFFFFFFFFYFGV